MTTPDHGVSKRATVDRILPGGLGLIHLEGRTILLPGTAPGDIVDVAVEGRSSTVVRLVQPGPGRVVPVCQDVEPCGGCDLMHLAYPAQLEAKRAILEDCLRRIARLEAWPAITVVGSPAELGYRWRAAFHVAADGSLGYKARRSNNVVPIRRCHVLHPTLEAWRTGFAASSGAGSERISAMTDGERISVAAEGPAEVLTVTVGDETHRAAADGFFQANGALVARLVDEVVRMAVVDAGQDVLDLYAGVGLFSLPLARRSRSVTAVESDRRATDLLRAQLTGSKVGNVEVLRQRVERLLARPSAGRRADVVVLDPPRAGVGEEVARRIARLTPRRIVMVSCDPATFARDVRTFGTEGYALDELVLLDMFPQTHHLEVIGLLTVA